jgi:CHAT domain-containing protein
MRQIALVRIRHLRELLIDPLSLPADRELVIVPVDALQTVPWSALHDAPLSLSPSASFWANTQRHTRPGPGTVLLVAGPELPAAAGEIWRLSALHKHNMVICPPDSTVNNVAVALEDADTAHFACHGVTGRTTPCSRGSCSATAT